MSWNVGLGVGSGRTASGGFSELHFPQGHISSRTWAFLPSSPLRQPGTFTPNPRKGGSLPGSAFLSVEPLVSSCSGSQPQLSSCQTGFFKNISVFTQHDLIGLQCPCGLIAGGRGCAPGTLPAQASRVSIILGSGGSKATIAFSLSPCPGRTAL